jgi:hypothetical protein
MIEHQTTPVDSNRCAKQKKPEVLHRWLLLEHSSKNAHGTALITRLIIVILPVRDFSCFTLIYDHSVKDIRLGSHWVDRGYNFTQDYMAI